LGTRQAFFALTRDLWYGDVGVSPKSNGMLSFYGFSLEVRDGSRYHEVSVSQPGCKAQH
jgi:hypothetical protein